MNELDKFFDNLLKNDREKLAQIFLTPLNNYLDKLDKICKSVKDIIKIEKIKERRRQ